MPFSLHVDHMSKDLNTILLKEHTVDITNTVYIHNIEFRNIFVLRVYILILVPSTIETFFLTSKLLTTRLP